MSYMKQVYFVVEEKKEKEKKMNLEERSQKTKEDWIKILNHLKAKGFRGIKAEKEAARCLKEIEKNELKKAHEEYTENLNKLKNLWS
jgi:geranylgeranyl pyrophosphate synthase